MLILTALFVSALFAASPTAGILLCWIVGFVALHRSAISEPRSTTPPPLSEAPSEGAEEGFYAEDTGEAARVVHSPEGVMNTIHPVRKDVPKP